MKKEILVTHKLSVGISDELIGNISQTVHRGDRIGILGPNGSGKTTLLRTVAGLEGYLSGSLVLNGSVVCVPQVTEKKKSDSPEEKSGGQQALASLEQAFAQKPDLLILDEPTNHLDMHARRLLIQMVKEFRGTILCVSHDPWFLKQITNRLWIVSEGQIRSFTGSYDQYQEELAHNENSRERKLEVVAKEKRKLAESLKRETARVQRTRKIANESKADRSRDKKAIGYLTEHAGKAAAKNQKRFDAIAQQINTKESSLKTVKKKKVSGSIMASERGGMLLHVRDASLAVKGKAFLTGVSFDLAYGDRVAIVGRNGSGKSALVKAILGKDPFALNPPASVNPSIHIEYLDQHYSIVDPEKSVLDNAVDFSGAERDRVMHIIFAKDPKALKIELRERIEKLLHPIPIEKKIEVDTHQMSTINLIISNLSREASIYRNLREPPGYRGMGAAVASAIETACRDLSTGEWSNEAIIERLSKLSQNNFGRSIKDKIEKMISDLRS